MAILDRLRRGSRTGPTGPQAGAQSTGAQSTGAQSVASEPTGSQPAGDRAPITATDLWRVPGWMQVPPPAPLLDPVRLVASRTFSEDLVSWQRPAPFLAPLGHAVTEMAPAGVIEMIAAAPLAAPAAEPVTTSRPDAAVVPPLDLARPGASGGAGPAAPAGFRTFGPEPGRSAPAFRFDPGAPQPTGTTAGPTANGPAGPAAEGPSVAAPPASRELVGDRPLRPGVDPAGPATAAGPATPAGPNTANTSIAAGRNADAPSMPLANRPDAGPGARPRPAPYGSALAGGSPSRSTFPEGFSQSLPTGPGGATQPVAGGSGADSARGSSGGAVVALQPLGAARSYSTAPVPDQLPVVQLPARLLSERGGLGSTSGGDLIAADAAGPADTAPAGSIPSPGDTSTSPLLGDRDVLPGNRPAVADPRPADPEGAPGGALPVAPGQRAEAGDEARPLAGGGPRRSGLGAPMGGLPNTAATLNVTEMIKTRAGRQRLTSMARPQGPDLAGVMAAVTGRAGSGAGGAAGPATPPARPAGPSWAELPVVAHLALAGGTTVPLEPVTGAQPSLAGLDGPALAALPGIPPGTAPGTLPGSLDHSELSPLDLARAGAGVLSGQSSLAMAPLASQLPPLLPLGAAPAPAVAAARAGAPAPAEGSAVRSAVGHRHGLDLSRVPVDRSNSAAASAAAMGARAFTSPAGIAIPRQAGSLDHGPGAAVLAHELTHVAQQARAGGPVAAEDSPAGRRMEAEALAVEAAMSAPLPVAPRPAAGAGGPGSRPSGVSLHPNRSMHTGASAHPGGGAHPGGSEAPPAARARAGVPTSVAAADAPLPVASPPRGPDAGTLVEALRQLGPVGAAAAPVDAVPQTVTYTPASFPPGAGPAPAGPPAMAGVQRAAEVHEAAPSRPLPATPVAGQWSTLLGRRPSEAQLHQIANWLYPLLAYRLRNELRENRERAGMLTDTYRRW